MANKTQSATTRPSYGFLFEHAIHTKFYYVSLNEAQLSNSQILSWQQAEGEPEALLPALVPPTHCHPIPLNFSHLVAHSRDNKRICASHKGLILISLRINSTYHVFNPCNNGQSYILPASPSLAQNPGPYSLEDATIVNYSTTECDFKVIRFFRRNGRHAEVYSSNTQGWQVYDLQCNLATFPDIWNVAWYLCGAVFVGGTLFFMARADHRFVVEVNIPQVPDAPINLVRLLNIPDGQHGEPTLHESGGYLYISYARRGFLGIWRLDRVTQAWDPHFIFENNASIPPKPHVVNYLNGVCSGVEVEPFNMHPERPDVIYLNRPPYIVAFYLNNDQVQEIQVDNELRFSSDFYLFSPCHVMLEHQNQPS